MFSLQVSKWLRELILYGKVEIGSEKSELELSKKYEKIIEEKNEEIKKRDALLMNYEQERRHMSNQYDKMYHKHQSFLRRKELYRLPNKGCVYLLTMKKDDMTSYKIGSTINITERVSHYRTGNPFCKVLFLIYDENYTLLETNMKKIYNKNLYPNNHECITGVSLDELIQNQQNQQ